MRVKQNYVVNQICTPTMKVCFNEATHLNHGVCCGENCATSANTIPLKYISLQNKPDVNLTAHEQLRIVDARW